MKKRVLNMMMILAMGLALAACGADDDKGNAEPTPTESATVAPTETPDAGSGTDEGSGGNEGEEGGESKEPAKEGTSRFVMDALVNEADRPAFMEPDATMLKDMYSLDEALFQDYVVLMPMMNISTTEFAVFQVKDAKDIPAVEEGIKKRAEAVQKSFEQYLPDQYENAKNYKLVTKGNFVMFAIAEDAADVAAKFEQTVK
jgi:predicted small lipoprotein YifL